MTGISGKGDEWLRVLLLAAASAYLYMVDLDARLALRLTLSDISEYFNSPSSNRLRGEAGDLVRACIPVLDALNSPYTPTPAPGSMRDVDHFRLRVDVSPEPQGAAVPPALVLALTDMTDYLAHLSRGGQVDYGMENYISAQCQGFLDELDSRSAA